MEFRKNIKQLILIFLMVVTVFVIAICFIRHVGETKEVMGEVGISQSQTIILDPGHGGMDGGAVGIGETVEKNINLQIALKLKDMLSLNGFDVIMTRDSDISIHDAEITSISRQKRSDMYNRLKIIEDYPNAIFISIHQNKFPQADSQGAQMFYSPNLKESEELARTLQQNFVTFLQPDNSREIKVSGEELFLLYHAKIPAVLVECGFLSNPEDCANLTSSEYQDKIAFTIFHSLMQFCNKDKVAIEDTENIENTEDTNETISLQQTIWSDLK